MRRFRTIWLWLTPGWLQRGQGELVQFVQGLIFDAYAERCRQSAQLMYPSLCPDDALPLLGADRAIPRGPLEPASSYRERLVRWRFPLGHRVRGSALALLDQVQAALRGTEYLTIDAHGTQFDGVTGLRTTGVVWDWDDLGDSPAWGKYWVIVKSTGSLPETWDEGEARDCLWDEPEDECWAGQDIHPGELNAVRTLARNSRLGWTPAGRRAVYLILYFDGETFPVPTGDWDTWAARPADHYAFEPLNDHET